MGPGLAQPAPLTSQHLARWVTGLFSPRFFQTSSHLLCSSPITHPSFREVPPSLWTLESPLIRLVEPPGPLGPLSHLWMDV